MSKNEIDAELIRQWKQEVCRPCRNSSNCPFVGEPYDPSQPYSIPKNYGYCWEDICKDGRYGGWEVHGDATEFISLKVDNRRRRVQVKPVHGFDKRFYVTDDGYMVVTNGPKWRVSGQRMEEPTWKRNLK